MSMTPDRLNNLRSVYRDGLLEDVIPFWLRHGIDREFGGILTGLDRDGSVIDTDKAVWLQGRAAWMFATLCNRVERREEWLAASRGCVDFIRRHCQGPGGKLYFSVTREGRPLRMRRYAYSECFASIGNAVYAQVTDDRDAKADAIRYFEIFLRQSHSPGVMPPKTNPETRPMQGLAPHMITIVTAQELRAALGDVTVSGRTLSGWIDRSIDTIERDFYKPDLGAVMEVTGPGGAIIDHFDGRMLTPGHAIEAGWFILVCAPAGRGETTSFVPVCLDGFRK